MPETTTMSFVWRPCARIALYRPFRTPKSPHPGHQVGFSSRSEEHTSELQSRQYLVCRLLLEKKTMLSSCPSRPLSVLCTASPPPQSPHLPPATPPTSQALMVTAPSYVRLQPLAGAPPRRPPP